MSAAVLVDTNVLVYATDDADPVRHATALGILAFLGVDRTVVSAQVLAEYASVLTHPRKRARPAILVAQDVARLAATCRVLPLDAEVVIGALKARERWQLEYYDAQIWAAAAIYGIGTVLSEDFAPCTLGGVRFMDPFVPGFAPAGL